MPNAHPLSRRRFIASAVALASTLELQSAAFAMGLGQQAQVCVLAAEQEQGPFFIKDEMLRSDVAENKPGLPLALRIAVMDSRSCKPLSGVAVDIWSCDALGLYSGFTSQDGMGFGGGPGGGPPSDFDPQHPGDRPAPPDGSRPPEGSGPPSENHPTDKLTFLRGIQVTRADGVVNFQTVFPGFYQGRTNHIHFRVRVGVGADGRSLPTGHLSHTGQIFFPEEMATELMKHPPYSNHAIHRTTQSEDHVFQDQYGALSIASVKARNGEPGYTAELIAAVDPSAVPKLVGGGGPGGPPRS